MTFFNPLSLYSLTAPLQKLYAQEEARAIILLLMEERFNITPLDLYANKVKQLSKEELNELENYIKRLAQGEPIQYILGKTTFYQHTFKVAPGVLIPRPETEGLITLILEHLGDNLSAPCHLLDVGTGSGCIACTLAKNIPTTRVEAWDISPSALAIAKENASILGVKVAFNCVDVLHPITITTKYDLIVSNPPYITPQEALSMHHNVLNYEPHIALFAPETDPLCFYKALGKLALNNLNSKGILMVEINEHLSYETQQLFLQMGFKQAILYKDKFNKYRFIKAIP